MLLLRFMTIAAGIRDAWTALKAVFKAARTRALGTRAPKTVLLPTRTWAQRFWSSLIGIFMIAEVTDWVISIFSRSGGLIFLAVAKMWPDHGASLVAWAANQITAFEPLATKLAGETMHQLTGAEIDAEAISVRGTPEEQRATNINIGAQFGLVLNQMFDVAGAAQDFQTRTGFSNSVNNMSAYFGTNILFQMRSLTIGTVASMSGWGVLRHLEQLHQSINWAFGFGWLSWTVMSTIMETTVLPGVTRYYNSQVKPRDLSLSQAIDATLRGFLDGDAMFQVMDNEGIMEIAREPMINLNRRYLTISESVSAFLRGMITETAYHGHLTFHAVVPADFDTIADLNEPTLSEAEVEDLYQRGRFDAQDVFNFFRSKEYRQTRADQKTTTVVEARTWKLLDQITSSYGRLYRDGVVTEGEYRQWLSAQNWSNTEIDLNIAWTELERRQRRFLSNFEMIRAVRKGLMTMQDVFDALQFQGYVPEDAVIVMGLALEEELPECDDEKLKQSALIAFLQAVGLEAGVTPALLRPQLLRYLQCLDPLVPIVLPTATIKATPNSLTIAGEVELEWETEFATEALITPQIGRVPTSGKANVQVTRTISYTLTARNPLGQTQAFVFINLNP